MIASYIQETALIICIFLHLVLAKVNKKMYLLFFTDIIIYHLFIVFIIII